MREADYEDNSPALEIQRETKYMSVYIAESEANSRSQSTVPIKIKNATHILLTAFLLICVPQASDLNLSYSSDPMSVLRPTGAFPECLIIVLYWMGWCLLSVLVI